MKYCQHAGKGPPTDGGCPWCAIEVLKWELVGEKAKFAAALEQREELQIRINVLLAERADLLPTTTLPYNNRNSK